MSGIRIQNWTYILRSNIITPVSTILLQENSFEARPTAGFFFASAIREVPHAARTFAFGHAIVTKPPYTFSHLQYTQPICVIAAGVVRRGRSTPTDYASLGPILGCARPFLAGIFFFPSAMRKEKLPGTA
jgi:hypothetical protein